VKVARVLSNLANRLGAFKSKGLPTWWMSKAFAVPLVTGTFGLKSYDHLPGSMARSLCTCSTRLYSQGDAARMRDAVLERAEQATSVLDLPVTSQDWDAIRAALRGTDRRPLLSRAVVWAALRVVSACGDLHEPIQKRGWRARDTDGHHYRHLFRQETELLRRLKIRAFLGSTDGRGNRLPQKDLRAQAAKIETAMVDLYPFFAEETDAAAVRNSARIALAIARHLATGVSLPADCSTGSDW
jgi:hypothetical protein